MSNQGNKNPDSVYLTSDDPMLADDQEVVDTDPDYTDTEDLDQDRSHNSEELTVDEVDEDREDLGSRQKNRERANRSRLSSFSSNKSQSSTGNSSAFSNLKALDKSARFRSPQPVRDSSGNKRERSSNSSVDDSFGKLPNPKKPVLKSPIDFITATGNQEKRPQNPPVKHTPVAPAKSARNRVPNPTSTGSAETTRQTMASRHIPDQNNTYDFSVVEQNSERVNINDIARKPEIAAVVLGLSRGDGLKSVQSFVSAGKKFSDAVVKSRNSGKKFIRAIGLLINIQTDPSEVTHTDLTKQRMMALCHKILYQSGGCKDYNSPLVGRINFGSGNPLTSIKPLLGAGFQFLGKVVIESYSPEHYKDGLLLFHLGCITLDYIRKTSAYTDPRSGSQQDPLIDPNEVDFTSYA